MTAEPTSDIPCEKCGNRDTAVVNTRGTRDGWIKRRRQCGSCGHRMNTFELTERDLLLHRKLWSASQIKEMRAALKEFDERLIKMSGGEQKDT